MTIFFKNSLNNIKNKPHYDGRMSAWWKTVKDILSGKAKGSKLIVLGVFLVGIGIVIDLTTERSYFVLEMLGIFAFVHGLIAYREEVNYELKRRRERERKRK